MYKTPSEPPTVAIVLNDDGTYHDRVWNWETAENFAMSGMRVVVIADDGPLTKDRLQANCDALRDAYRDCFGITD